MVSVLASGVTVRVATPTVRVFTTANVVDSVAIKWGRESLLSAPSKRSLTATLRTSSVALAQSLFKDMLRCEVSLALDGVTLFVGFIDGVEPERVNGVWFFHITAVEATGWNAELGKTFQTRAGSPGVLSASLSAVSGINPSYDNPLSWGNIQYRQPEVQETITVQQGWELLATPWPMQFPNWSPTYNHVGSTVWELDTAWGSRVLPADTMEGELGVQDTTELYRSFFFYSGGGYGEELYHTNVSLVRGVGQRNTANWTQITNPLAVVEYSQSTINAVTDLLQAQITAPRKLRIRDRVLQDAGYSVASIKSMFLTNETRVRYPTNTGDPMDELWPNLRYWTIGGKITFTHFETRHDMTSAYASKFAAP